MLLQTYPYRAAVSGTVFYGVRAVLFRKAYQVDRIGEGKARKCAGGLTKGEAIERADVLAAEERGARPRSAGRPWPIVPTP